MKAVSIIGVEKTYSKWLRRNGVRALDCVDLEVEPGIVFGLIGLNGAGKTTLIKTLLGVARPDSGSVRVLGQSPESVSVRARLGYLPERLELPGSWSPLAFLASVGRYKQVRDPRAEAVRQLTRVGMLSEARRRMRGFSKGMRQRVGLAAALVGTPDLLVLDEPTDGVDPLGRVEMRKLLADERERGATVFLNSHMLTEAERICDRIGIISHGRIVREGSTTALCGSETRWRVRFASGIDQDALRTIGFETIENDADQVWRCEAADPQQLDLILEQARTAGAHLVKLEPDTRELEDVLAEAVKEKGR